MCILAIFHSHFLIRRRAQRLFMSAWVFFCCLTADTVGGAVVDHGCFGFSLILLTICIDFLVRAPVANGWCSTHGQRPKTINKYKNKSTAIESANVSNVLFIFCEPKTESRTKGELNEMERCYCGAWHMDQNNKRCPEKAEHFHAQHTMKPDATICLWLHKQTNKTNLFHHK